MKYILIPALVALTACSAPISPVTRGEPEPLRLRMSGPPSATPDQCWGRHTKTPAVTETVTTAVLLHPAEIGNNGKIRREAIYKREAREVIVQERQDVWFETPCASDLTPDFIASVQRALATRGLYGGPITGRDGPELRAAIRSFQAPQGLDSAILSMAAARQLGLVSMAREGA